VGRPEFHGAFSSHKVSAGKAACAAFTVLLNGRVAARPARRLEVASFIAGADVRMPVRIDTPEYQGNLKRSIHSLRVGIVNIVVGRRSSLVKKDGQSSAPNTAATAAARAIDWEGLTRTLSSATDPEQCCSTLSQIFEVRRDEIGLLRLENEMLHFLFPRELVAGGAIPLSSPTAIAAHTAVARKAVLFNTFNKVKHASIFESIKLTGEQDEGARPSTIHKLMSAPVVDEAEKVLGVLQICRKGFDPISAGADFTIGDLQKLEFVTRALAQGRFMRQEQ
jgi:hypothetical protein